MFPDSLLNALKAMGKVVLKKEDCHLKLDGVRFEIHQPPDWYPQVKLYGYRFFLRGENGGMELYSRASWFNEVELITNIRALISQNPPSPKTKKEHTPVFLKFVENSGPNPKFIVSKYGNHLSVVRSELDSQIDHITNIRIVSFDGVYFTPDILAPDKNNLMFHLECMNRLGATFDIITNGEEFMPVDRYTKYKNGRMKATKYTNPKASVDLTKMTKDDQEIIKYAMECCING